MDPQQKITLELTVEKVNVILSGLGELPGKVCIPLIEEIKQQAVMQLQATPAAPVPTAE